MITSSDKKTRDVAIPFEATAFGRIASGSYDDSAEMLSTTKLLVAVRCSTPDRGALTEAHLNVQMTVGSALKAKIAIGRFASDGITAVESLSDIDLDIMNKQITGQPDGIASVGSTLLIDGVNLFPFIPKRGEAGFNADGFVLIFKFNRVRTSSDQMKRFDLQCSAQMGLL